MPVASKIAEKVVTEQLTDFLNSGQALLHPMQFGFRKNHSTEMATCYFLKKIKSKLDSGSAVGAVFLDLKKAFDTVNHNVLLSKLSNFNFSDDVMKWMESYLTMRRQCTRVGNKMSSFINCSVGVPQGSVLGPLLFSLYVNDLPLACPEVETQMYADDTVILAHGRDRCEVAAKLTAAMAKIATWKSNGNQPDIFVNGEKIQTVSHFKYLGVTVDSQLSFKKHIKQVCNTVKFNLRNFRYIRNQLPLDAAKLYMHSMIFSHNLHTASQVGHKLEKQTLKVLDKKPSSHHHCNIIQKHKLLTFENLVCLADVSLVYRVIHNLAAPPLKEFISLRPDNRTTTRTTSRGHCAVQHRCTEFGRSAFSVRATNYWNSVPNKIRDISTFTGFKSKIKSWLKSTQSCTHQP